MLAWLFILPKFCLATEKIIINEIQITGGTGKTENDFIEFYNPNSSSVNLKGYRLVKRTKAGLTDTSIKSWTTDTFILGKDYYLWANSKEGFATSVNADVSTTGTIAADNGVALRYGIENTGEIIDSVGWGSSANIFNEILPFPNNPLANQSIGRKNFIDTENNANDFYIFTSPTPGAENVESIIPPEPPKTYSSKIRLNEILPKPLKGETEFIELYNSGDREDLTGWRLEDGSKSKCELEGEIKTKEFYLVPNCKIKLNDTQGETLTLFNPAGEKVSYLEYAGSAKENISYNFDGSGWRWSQFLTPGKENKFNSPPTSKTKKNKNFYVGVYADFEAKGSDKDKDKLKYVWDFGDGHKSYKAKTRHKYEKKGKYTVTLKISDGAEDKIETYNIEVKTYPKRDVDIIELSPNPKGKDTENEYVILENKEKKDINLNGWSIATGSSSKKLINHPITQDLIISKKGTVKVTREFSKFSLNNTKGKIELRYPNGKVSSRASYDKGKGGVAEGELFFKNGKKWQWKVEASEKIENMLSEENLLQQVNDVFFPVETNQKIALPPKKEINFKFINFASKINPSAEIIRLKTYPLIEQESKYFFNSYLPERKHYFFSFWEKLRI